MPRPTTIFKLLWTSAETDTVLQRTFAAEFSATPDHSWAKFKKTAKKGFKKFVKSLDHTCVSNDFTNFECEGQATGNRSYVNLQKLAMKNS